MWFVFVSLFLIAYTGSLLNHLFWASAVQSKNLRELPIDSLDDLVRLNYTFGCLRGSQTYRYLTEVAEGDEFDKIRDFLKTSAGDEALVGTVQAGVEKVRTEERYAFIGETMILKHETNKQPCDVMTVGEQFALRSYGLAVPKNSVLLEPLHNAVLQMVQDGDLAELERKWWVDRGQCYAHKMIDKTLEQVLTIAAVEPQRISLTLFWQPVVILVVGCVLAVILAVVETVYFKYRGRVSYTLHHLSRCTLNSCECRKARNTHLIKINAIL